MYRSKSLLHRYTYFQEAAAFPWTQEGPFRVLRLSQDTRTGRGGRGERSACLPAFSSPSSYIHLWFFFKFIYHCSIFHSVLPFFYLLMFFLPPSFLPSLPTSLPLPPFFPHSLPPFVSPPSLPPSLPPSEPSQFSGGGVPSVSSHTHSSSLTSNGYRDTSRHPHQHSGYICTAY